MTKIIVKATSAKTGIIEGTGAGTQYPAFTARKFSKEFILKGGGTFDRHTQVDVKAGDNVVFAYK